MGHPFWPLFDLEVRTPTLTLRYIDDELGRQLAELTAHGVHDPSFMPFTIPWTDAESPRREQDAFRYWWRCRADTTVASWSINLAVLVDGEPVGASGLIAQDFPVLRRFETGSWLGLAHHGRGLGTELRVATLQLGFEGFGADRADTGAFTDNGPSLGVTRKLGYSPNGERNTVRRGERAQVVRYSMDREHWSRHVRRDDITLHGVDGARALLGLDEPG